MEEPRKASGALLPVLEALGEVWPLREEEGMALRRVVQQYEF